MIADESEFERELAALALAFPEINIRELRSILDPRPKPRVSDLIAYGAPKSGKTQPDIGVDFGASWNLSPELSVSIVRQSQSPHALRVVFEGAFETRSAPFVHGGDDEGRALAWFRELLGRALRGEVALTRSFSTVR